MNASNHVSTESRSRVSSVALCLLGFIVVGVGGLWLHIAVLPLPIETTAGFVARYLYFVLWLGCLVHFLGRAFFGSSSQTWHCVVFLLLGIQLGALGGYFFAGILGCIVGALSGVLLSPLIFITRHRFNHDA